MGNADPSDLLRGGCVHLLILSDVLILQGLADVEGNGVCEGNIFFEEHASNLPTVLLVL